MASLLVNPKDIPDYDPKLSEQGRRGLFQQVHDEKKPVILSRGNLNVIENRFQQPFDRLEDLLKHYDDIISDTKVHKRPKWGLVLKSVQNYSLLHREPTNEFVTEERLTEEIFLAHKHTAFKVNLAYGFVLKLPESEGFRYFYASSGPKFTLFDHPAAVTSRGEWKKFLTAYSAHDPEEFIRSRLRETSADKLEKICNVTFFMYHTQGAMSL